MKKKKAKPRKAIARSKANPPEIYVKVIAEKHGSWYTRHDYARAHIRVKAGEYQYLEWRDGEKIRSLYLGKKRDRARKV